MAFLCAMSPFSLHAEIIRMPHTDKDMRHIGVFRKNIVALPKGYVKSNTKIPRPRIRYSNFTIREKLQTKYENL